MLMYCGVVDNGRGTVVVGSSTDLEDDIDFFVAMPLQPVLDLDDTAQEAILERLLDDVVASGYYAYYEWRPEDG